MTDTSVRFSPDSIDHSWDWMVELRQEMSALLKLRSGVNAGYFQVPLKSESVGRGSSCDGFTFQGVLVNPRPRRKPTQRFALHRLRWYRQNSNQWPMPMVF